MLYKDAWKKLVNFQDKKQILSEEQVQKDEGMNSFQRKIDPSLDQIYNFQISKKQKKVNNLKVLVVSAEHIAFYGHMARVG